MANRSNRRDFMKTTAAAGAGFWAAGGVSPKPSRA
ncbi:MAG: twin-arginine translocation signal domain-containing protein, partial [Planctomycetota bacterium]|nr:twin-arginine translocation signal domain-containing protein [Planctomycetota bacterium]